MAVEVTTVGSAGDARKLVICSVYFPHGEEVPSLEIVKLVDLCQSEGLPLLIGCDVNVHHTIWGSTGTNERGRRLLEYLVTTDLEVLNRGNKPTFCTAGRSEVLDLTLCSLGFVRKVREWKVSNEPSLSDHRLITFRLSDLKVEVKKVRNPKRTDLVSYQRDLGIKLRDFPKRYGTAEELELCVDYLQRALIGSYEANCPASTVTNNRGTPWWNPRLQGLRIKARRAWNKARNTGRPSDWDLFTRDPRRSTETLWWRRRGRAGGTSASRWRACQPPPGFAGFYPRTRRQRWKRSECRTAPWSDVIWREMPGASSGD
ncbi:PREDICTED: uncharacterized protein LOC108761587 [Trachymyrmex cornetzi]|uniref:uncharacterized protein LOC108761587 n=1 Tax=Trachymyrmex cornetzi TaxID=471704 RepID=UPI00084F1A9D|nr:PREDICTED: uncharacterized protein LOC108761587 [Trachymyrmex cornetzi]